jgi:hypothetical protein
LQEFQDEIPIADDVHRVLSDRLEAELRAEKLAINAVRVSGHGSAAEWEDRDPWDEARKSIEVGEESVGVGEEEMGPPDRLSALREQSIEIRQTVPNHKPL